MTPLQTTSSSSSVTGLGAFVAPPLSSQGSRSRSRRRAAAPIGGLELEQQAAAAAGLLDGIGSSPFSLALAPEAQMVFEPQLDSGALTSLLVVAAVVTLFWARVWVAISDRQKREAVEKLAKEARLKRLSGTLSEEEAAALRRAEEDQATPVLGPVGSWLRGLRLVTAPREEDDQPGGGR